MSKLDKYNVSAAQVFIEGIKFCMIQGTNEPKTTMEGISTH